MGNWVNALIIIGPASAAVVIILTVIFKFLKNQGASSSAFLAEIKDEIQDENAHVRVHFDSQFKGQEKDARTIMTKIDKTHEKIEVVEDKVDCHNSDFKLMNKDVMATAIAIDVLKENGIKHTMLLQELVNIAKKNGKS